MLARFLICLLEPRLNYVWGVTLHELTLIYNMTVLQYKRILFRLGYFN